MRFRAALTTSALCAAALAPAACGGDERAAATPAGPKRVKMTAPVRQARVLARIPVGREPCGVAAAGGSVWVSDHASAHVLEIDPATDKVVREVAMRGRPCELAADGDRLWVVTGEGDYVEGVDVATGRIVARIRGERGRGRPAVGEGEVWWSSDTQNQVVSRYTAGGRLVRRIEEVGSLEAGPTDLARGAGAVWVANEDGTVQRIDPRSGEVTDTIEAGPRPAYAAFRDGSLWIANLGERTLRRLDAHSKRVTHVLEGGGGDLALDEQGGLWAVGANAKTMDGEPEPPLLYGYDARTGAATARLQVGETPRRATDLPPLQGVAAAYGAVWVGSPADGALYRIEARG
jgi:streptogramin lyase